MSIASDSVALPGAMGHVNKYGSNSSCFQKYAQVSIHFVVDALALALAAAFVVVVVVVALALAAVAVIVVDDVGCCSLHVAEH